MAMRSSTYYDRYWSDSGFNPTGFRLPQQVEEILLATVPDTSSCLDIGCGAGTKVHDWVEGSQIQYTGVDISEEAVNAANRLGLNATRIEDPSQLPFADESFDFVISFEVLEHLLDPLEALREAHRLLKPGGKIIVTVPNAVFVRARIQFMFGIWNPRGDSLSVEQPWRDPHIRFFTTRSLASMFDEAGFSIVEKGGHQDRRIGKARTIARALADTPFFGALQTRFPNLFCSRLHLVAVKER